MDSEKPEENNIYEIFDLVQQSSACHLKYALQLKKTFEKHNTNDLLDDLCKCLQFAFLTDFKEKNIFLERIISFTALFSVSFKPDKTDDVVHPILSHIFRFILKLSNSPNPAHRYWSCKLFNKMFHDMEELSDELYEEIKEAMFERFRDPKSVIRCQAIIALHRLQDPTDPQDPIICRLCAMLDSDFNSKVRQLCLEKIAFNKHTMPFVLNRIRDVDANVRLTVFQKLCSIAKYLKVSQRRLILQCGFNDASEKIRNFVANELLQGWFSSYDSDYLKLMQSIRLDACEEDIKATTHLVELVLRALFKSAPVATIIECIEVDEQKLIEYKNLNWETVLYYRIAVQFLRQSEGFEDALNTVIPELVFLCRYIKGYVEFTKEQEEFDELEYHFTLQQFFMITQGYDVCDTSGRQCLNALVHDMLQKEDLPTDVAEIVLNNLEKTIPDVKNRSIFVCEIISNIVYGEDATDYEEAERQEREKNHTIMQLQSDLISLAEQERHFVYVEKNYAEADRVKHEIEEKEEQLKKLRTVRDKPEQAEKKTDAPTMFKVLSVAEALLRSPTLTRFNPAIATLHSEVINPALIHEDDRVKAKALKCYALCCVIDRRSARYGIHLFSGLIFANDLEDVQILLVSLNATVDILTIYGLSLVEKRDEEEMSGSRCEEEMSSSRCEEERKVFVGGTSLTDLIQALADHLEHEDPQVQETATKGVCILLLHSRITSSSLLSRIIIKWANPATDNERLKQFIGLTLSSLTALSNCHLYFADAVISTIRTLTYAPKGSALLDINVENIMKFMTTLCRMPSQGTQIHTDLAFKICRQMRDRPKIKINYMFSKTLLLLVVPDDKSIDDLLIICDELKDILRDNHILRNINKFTANLTKNNVKLNVIKEEDASSQLFSD